MRLIILISCVLNFLNVYAQTGYFKTADDLLKHNIVEFEEVSCRSSAFGCNVNFFTNGKKEERFDQDDIFAFVKNGEYFRFYKYAIVQMLVRGEVSFLGLIPTSLSYNKKNKIFTIEGTDKMLLFVSAGPSGELKPMKKKYLLEIIKNDEEILNLYTNKKIDFLNCILLYNLNHPTPDAFVMNKDMKMTLGEFAEEMDRN